MSLGSLRADREPFVEAKPPLPTDVLACPGCHGALSIEEEAMHCKRCGQVGRIWEGIPDFLHPGASLLAAEGGTLDLRADEGFAARLVANDAPQDYEQMKARATELVRPPLPTKPLARRAQARFEALYDCVACEVGMDAGLGDVVKTNAALAARGLPALSGRWGLEAGGGFGLHLPGVRNHFDGVVMLDCSLVFLLVARQLCADLGLKDMYFVRGNLEALPFRDGSLDFIHENGVIEHVLDPQAIVDEALRCITDTGVYVCLSPNRFPITPEPHFRLPLFGLWPKGFRRYLLPIVRGLDSEAGTDLRSLRQIRHYFRRVPDDRRSLFFIPPTLETTVRSTPLRRALGRVLELRGIRRIALFAINRLMLPIAPYHVTVVHGQARPR